MRTILSILFTFLSVEQGICQLFTPVDSTVKPAHRKPDITVMINPTLMACGQLEGAVGYQPSSKIAFMLGGGYNYDIYTPTNYGCSGRGYTINAAVMIPTGPLCKNYISLNASFREWKLIEVSASSEPTIEDFDDFIINPITFFSSPISDGQNIFKYKADAFVWCYDVQDVFDIVRTKNFIWQGYAGLGIRDKTIDLTYIGYYYSPSNLTFIPEMPSSAGTLYSIVPDIKLGLLIGFRF
jgi:hypothetical protein